MSASKTPSETQKNLAEAQEKGRYIRQIRSFVKREGRLTKGQAAAMERSWPTMGLEHAQGPIHLSEVFGRTWIGD